MASEGAVASSCVVVDEPWAERIGAFGVAGEDLSVGPLAGERAVVVLDFAVLPRAERADELVADRVFGEELSELGAVPVGPGVVRD